MKVLVFGGNGQVGQELLRALVAHEVVATTRSGVLSDGTSCLRADFDQPQSLATLLDAEHPDLVVNAAAYTAVDKAEGDRDAAFRANAQAPGVIASWCAAHDVPLVHYSTDYVFDGQGKRPYLPDDATAALGVYGESKRAGEAAIRAEGGKYLIFRTAWVYASHGNNFLRTMLRVGAERDELRVVADQIGTPTPAALIADVTAQVLRHPQPAWGTYHLTALGQTSWHGFAEEIFAQAQTRGLIARMPKVTAITTADYPTPARRPSYSCLDTTSLLETFGIRLPDWREGVARVLGELLARV
jgi:dTDP-4-dehydrorhamnose reductase